MLEARGGTRPDSAIASREALASSSLGSRPLSNDEGELRLQGRLERLLGFRPPVRTTLVDLSQSLQPLVVLLLLTNALASLRSWTHCRPVRKSNSVFGEPPSPRHRAGEGTVKFDFTQLRTLKHSAAVDALNFVESGNRPWMARPSL